MCGRFLLSTPAEKVAEVFGVQEFTPLAGLKARYNIAPSQMIPVIRERERDGRHIRTFSMLRWGLVPSWADDPAIGNKMINARSEGAGTKPAFRTAFQRRRCLIPADGFYEWKKIAPKAKQPMLIRAADHLPFGMAGLWERWRPKDAAPDSKDDWIETCTILTCAASDLLAGVHDRMPVILEPEEYAAWLDPEIHDAATLKPLLDPAPAGRLEMFPVGRDVNRPGFDDPRCAQPVSTPATDGGEPSLFS